MIKGTPWAPIDGTMEQAIPIQVDCRPHPGVGVPEAPQIGPMQIRRMKIPKEAYMKYGQPMCKGCAMFKVGRSGAHSDECIKKVEMELMNDPEWAERIGTSYEIIGRHMARQQEVEE